MKIINDWILKRASAIQEREKVKATKLQEERDKKYRADLYLLQVRRNSIITELRKLVTELKGKECHIKEGDEAVINYYSLGRNGHNGWDGGPSTLISSIPEEELTKPVTVRITDVYVDTSLALELVDLYFAKHSIDYLSKRCPIEDSWFHYCKWLNSRGSDGSLGNRYGLYKTAKFDYMGSFKPKWGLNVDSFLTKGTPEYDKTIDLWTREIEIKQRQMEVKEEMDQLEEELRKITSELSVPK